MSHQQHHSMLRSLHLGNVRPHLQTFGGGSLGDFLDSGNIMNSGLLPARLDLFSTPTRGRSNTNGSVHSMVPETSINYELFSLKRIMSLSTGTYPVSQSTHNSNDYLIDTSQWEEISMSQSYWNKYIMKEKKSSEFLDYDKASSDGSLGNPSTNNLETSSISSGTNASQNVAAAAATTGVVGDEFIIKQNSTTATSASPRKRPTSETFSKDLSNVSKPVTFKSVISGGSSTLYNVIACLCSNNVIVLRFFGTVKYIERDDEKHKQAGKYSEDDEMSETESVASVGSANNNNNNMGGTNLRMEDDEDYSTNRLCSPIVRCLSYFQENEIDIETISMEESARWLSCITAEGDVYIVPICRLFFPYNSDNSYPFKKNQDDANGGGINLHPSLMDYTLYQVDTPTESPQHNSQFTEVLSLNLMKNIELVIANSSSSLKKHQQVQKYYQQHLSQTQSLLEPIERVVLTSNTQTKRQYTPLKHGQVTCSAWWVSFSNHPLKKYYVIFGTDRGFLIFLNLHTLKEDSIIGGFKYGIKNIRVISDDKSVKFALLTCGKGVHYKQILEQMDLNFQSFRSICDFNQTSGMSYGTSKDAKKDLQNDIETFKLRKIDQFSNSACYMNVKWFDERGVNMISCLDKEKHSFSLYDVETVSRANDPSSRKRRDDEIYPLFQYQVNESTSLLHPTNRLLFSIHRGGGEGFNKRGVLGSPSFERYENEYQERLFVMSRSSLLVNSNTNNTKNNSILQEFLLPSNEMVKGFISGFMYREDSMTQYKFKDEATQYELEGVILWTQTGIYELRQKYAPLKIFEYIISNKQNIVKDSAQVDQFGQTFELDILKLYEQYADEKFENGDTDFAFTLYKLSNINEVKYVQRLSQAKKSEEAFNYLLSVLENSGSIPLSKRRQLSNLLFDCFMQKLISNANHDDCDVELCKQFKKFLLTNGDINPQVVISQLVQYCCCGEFKSSQEQTIIINMELVLEIAHKHNLVKYTLQFLVSRGYIGILTEEGGIGFLYDHEYAYTTQMVGYGVLLQHCSANTKLRFLVDYLETMRSSRAKLFAPGEEKNDNTDKDEFFGAMNFGKKAIGNNNNPQEGSPIKQQLFFEDSIETIHYNSKLFDNILTLLPRVDDICLLLSFCTKFNPEENSFITKETRQTSSALMKDPSYTRYFYYPYIHLEQHLEVFIIAMLCLVNLKKKLAFNLPDSTNSLNISSNNLYTHTQEKLEQCIKCYNMYRKQFIVSYCLKLHNKSALALIYEKDEMWTDALCCKLVQLKENFHNVLQQQPQMVESLLKQFYIIFDRYLTNRSNELDEETKLKMLEKLFNFYCSLSLPVAKLEDHCLRNIHIIGDVLSLLLLLPSPSNTTIGNSLKKNLKFSHQFYLKITQSYVRNVKRHEKEEEKSTKNLLQQVFRNMEKDIYKRNYISITQSEISRLGQQDEKLVVFTCGDHFTRTNFTNNILPEFKNRTSQLVSLMNSDLNKKVFNLAIDLILKDYQNLLEERCMHTNQACPICVFNFFLKNEKSKIQKLKPQASRMFHQQQLLHQQANNNNNSSTTTTTNQSTSSLSEGTLQYIANVDKITPWSM